MSVNIQRIFNEMPNYFIKGKASGATTFYFSIGKDKYTVKVDTDTVAVEPGKTVESADVILKTTPELFEKMVIKGKMPGPIDIARGKIKTNDPAGLQKLRELFDFKGL